jgi:hypothetical protein
MEEDTRLKDEKKSSFDRTALFIALVLFFATLIPGIGILVSYWGSLDLEIFVWILLIGISLNFILNVVIVYFLVKLIRKKIS